MPAGARIHAAKAIELYEQDGYTWAQVQAEALRRRDYDLIDWDHVIEEIEELVRVSERSWRSHCGQTLLHLLKIERAEQVDPGLMDKWRKDVWSIRVQMAILIRDNPGMQGKCDELLAQAWEETKSLAHFELAQYDREATDIASQDAASRRIARNLPRECPYSLHEVTAYRHGRGARPQEDVWPPQVAIQLNALLGTNYPLSWRGRELRGGGRQR